MIWVINHHSEYDGTFPTFRYYREVIGRENVSIFSAGDNEDFSFLKPDDVVLLRSGDKSMVEKLQKRQAEVGFKSTIEPIETILAAYDKEAIKNILNSAGIKTPETFRLEDIPNSDTRKYFVKPKYGEDSKYIDLQSVCNNKGEVLKKCSELVRNGVTPIIEEYIDGIDSTVAVIKNATNGEFPAYGIDINVENDYGIQTFDVKKGTISYCSITSFPNIEVLARKAFRAIGAKHYARVDFRTTPQGESYLIDLNIFPGFGIAGYMYRSLMLTANKSYRDFIMDILSSATPAECPN